jgi:hypothetical protein
LLRAFREPQAAASVQVRKSIEAAAQIYTEGFFLQATAFAMNSRTVQLKMTLDQLLTFPSEKLRPGQPVGLIMAAQDQSERLVAQIEQVDSQNDGSVVELSFPKVLNSRQGDRIDTLLKLL